MGDEQESFGYDDMFDTASFYSRFHSARARAQPSRDLNKSLFRSSGFSSGPHETMDFETNTPSRRTRYVNVVPDGMPSSVSEARYMTSYANESFVDEYDD